ncbi:aminotransferase class V-fold PLP-dependent enzyme [Marinomonas mediterranea]|jgi:Selenocysteine lyase|uniref:Cysteine desulfurase n=1 Tax=Marinomonas mediterranea (strain ATCC 700492 / JCM 21426 / NBRC 103028 / MMB-1) TaxID=717774 RepID=F2K1Q0_MARM1|nr:aminotransferase class V-fold PLP-dependent enzyme [Marinomonas mediterranea]ADZ93384.1 Cysteine desulfurase [Marinomonas mediterranea MMB-1]WCN19378.1 aminotransferase class V-fold PLP-dependent enzyme [Marinomonas mediterranea MMB-1]
MTSLDLEFVRAQFPAFREPSLQGQAFFENAGGSYACQQVIDRLTTYYRETKLQPYHVHPASQKAGDAMDISYKRFADYLNVDEREVHFGPSTSQNTYVLAQAFASLLTSGDEIIVTNQDHEANSGVWRRLASQGIVVKEWQVDPKTGLLSTSDLDRLITEKTKLLAFPHCSNIVAHINPVKAICAQARANGIVTVVDGVSYAGHGFPDVRELGADIYLFSLYKTYGPHLGVMVIRNAVAERLGNQSHYFNASYRNKWFVPAGPDHAQVAAAQGVLDYFDLLHDHHFQNEASVLKRAERVRALLHDAEVALLQPLLDFVDQHPKLRLLGPADASQRAATVALMHSEMDSDVLAKRLVEKGIICGAAHFYAVRLLEAMGIDADKGVLRLSFVHYTTPDEMTQLVDALSEVC